MYSTVVDLSVLEMAATSMNFIHQLPINSSPLLSSPLLVTTTTARQVTATNYMALHGELGF